MSAYLQSLYKILKFKHLRLQKQWELLNNTKGLVEHKKSAMTQSLFAYHVKVDLDGYSDD